MIVQDINKLRTMSSEWNGNIEQLEEIVNKMGDALKNTME